MGAVSSSKPSEAENQPSTQLKEIPNNLLTLTDKLIAEGSFAKVFEGFLRRGTDTNNEEDRYDEQCAVKVFKKGAKVQVQKHMTEAILAFKVSSTGHPNIVTVFGIWRGYNSGQLAIVMERCLTSLYDMIQSPKNGSEEMKLSEKRSLLLEVCQGMQFLTQKKVFHGDLTTKNILLVRDRSTKRLVPKIGDFGLSKVLVDSKPVRDSVHQGNEDFMPPEMLKVGKLKDALSEGAEQIDLFSFGCCALHVGTGVYPAPGPLIQQGRLSTSQETASPFQRREGPLVKLSSSEAQLFRPIVHKCLMFKPSERGTFADVLSILEAHEKGYADVDTRHLYEDAVTEREDMKIALSTANKEKESMQHQLTNKEESITKMKNLHEQATEDQGKKTSEKEAENKSLSEKLLQCQSKCADADSLAERLKQQVKELEGELKKEQTNKNSLQKRLEERESDTSRALGFTENFQKLVEEKVALQTERSRLSDNLLTKTTEWNQQNSKLQALSLDLEKTKESLQAANSQMNDLEGSLRKSGEKCHATEQSLLKATKQCESFQKQNKKLHDWNKTLPKVEELKNSKEINSELTRQVQKVQSDLSKAEQARQDLKESLTATTTSKQQLAADIESLETAKSSLTGEKYRLDQEVLYLKRQLEESNALAESRKEQHSTLDVQNKVVVAQLEEAKASLEKTRKENENMHRQIGELKKENGRLESTVEDKDEEIGNFREQIATRKVDVDSLQKSLADTKNQSGLFRKGKSKVEKECGKLKSELNSLMEQAKALRTEKDTRTSERDRVKNTLDVRVADLQISESKVTELQKEIAILKTTVEGEGGLHEQCKTLASDNEQLQVTLKKMQGDLAEVTSLRDCLSTLLEDEKLKLEKANEQIEQLKDDKENKDEEIRALNHYKQTLGSDLATANKKQDRLHRQIEAIKTEHESDLSFKEEEYSTQQKNLKTEHEKEIAIKQGQVEENRKLLSGLEEERNELKAECRNLLEMKEKGSLKMTELLSSKTRINQLEAEREYVKSSLAAATSRIQELEGALEAAEEKAQEVEKHDQQSQKLLEKYRKENVAFETKLVDFQVASSETEKLIEKKVAQLKEKDDQLTSLKEILEHLRTELRTLKFERSQHNGTVTERDKRIERLLSEQLNSQALSQRAEDRERECAELKESLQNSGWTLSARSEENQTLKQASVEKDLSNGDLKRQLDVMVEQMREKDCAIAQLKENSDKQNLLWQNLEKNHIELQGHVRKLNSKCAEGDGYKLKYEGAIADNRLQLMQEKLSELERNCRDATSRFRAVSSDIVSVQPQLYLFSQLTETFDSFYSRDISDVVHKKQPLPPCNDLDMRHFGDDWKARLPTFKHGCKNPDVESFLSSVAKSNPQCHCHGHFCITMLSLDGYPELHFFVVSSCELLLSDTASLQPQQRRYICEVFPIDSKWWIDAKLPKLERYRPILFKPVGLFPNYPSNLDELPVSLKPIVSWISERLCLKLRTLIAGVGCHLHRSDVGLAIHPTCSVRSREV